MTAIAFVVTALVSFQVGKTYGSKAEPVVVASNVDAEVHAELNKAIAGTNAKARKLALFIKAKL